jgi:hypothetical protein
MPGIYAIGNFLMEGKEGNRIILFPLCVSEIVIISEDRYKKPVF